MTASRHHNDWIQAYVQLFSGRTEAPDRLHWWVGIATIAGALTRRVWIDETIFRYYPNFYIVFVSPPGHLTKSTTISLGTNMLKQLDHIYLSADTTTYPAFITNLAKHHTEMRESEGETPVDDLWIRQCAVTASISEFGTFFKPEDEDMVNGLTDLWDCRPIMVKETKFNGTDVIEHPFVNLIAGTTPSWIQSKIKDQLGGWGLSSRIIFVFADEKARYIARPSKHWTRDTYDKATKRLIEDLRQIADLNGEFAFTGEADEFAQVWYEELGHRIEAHSKEPDGDAWLGHFLARKQAHVHKLAMVLSASRHSDLLIHAKDLQEAIEAVDAVEQEVPRIFKRAPEPMHLARLETEVLERLRGALETSAGGRLPRSDLFHRIARLVDSSTANRIIDNAIGRGFFKQLVSGGTAYLRLPEEPQQCPAPPSSLPATDEPSP